MASGRTDRSTPKSELQIWGQYVDKKRAGQAGRRPVADVLIEAFARRFELDHAKSQGLCIGEMPCSMSFRNKHARILDQRIGFLETAGAS
jgi:hypothetical protein